MPHRIRQNPHARPKPLAPSYPIVTRLEYRLTDEKCDTGPRTGRTVTISRREVSFESESRLPLGALVEVGIVWPVKLDNSIPLKLQIHGRAVRVSGNITTVEILRYEFHTLARRASLDNTVSPEGRSRALADIASAAPLLFARTAPG
jgi:hypothetical protein